MVVRYLVAEGGVSPGRLEAKGFGESKPAIPFDALFESTMRDLRVELVAAGVTDESLHTLRERLEAHHEELAKVVAEIGDDPHAEVHRRSTRYGIEGRIDVVRLPPGEIDILELKTGGYENPEHERQLRLGLVWTA